MTHEHTHTHTHTFIVASTFADTQNTDTSHLQRCKYLDNYKYIRSLHIFTGMKLP